MQVHFRTKRPFTSGIEVVVVFVVACTFLFEREMGLEFSRPIRSLFILLPMSVLIK